MFSEYNINSKCIKVFSIEWIILSNNIVNMNIRDFIIEFLFLINKIIENMKYK